MHLRMEFDLALAQFVISEEVQLLLSTYQTLLAQAVGIPVRMHLAVIEGVLESKNLFRES